MIKNEIIEERDRKLSKKGKKQVLTLKLLYLFFNKIYQNLRGTREESKGNLFLITLNSFNFTIKIFQLTPDEYKILHFDWLGRFSVIKNKIEHINLHGYTN